MTLDVFGASDEEETSLLDQATTLKHMLIARARNQSQNDWEYRQLRHALVTDPTTSKVVPGRP
jgi:hypothetical protein